MEKQIVSLRKQGKNSTEIGEIVGLHRTTVAKVLRANGFDTSRRTHYPACVICGVDKNRNRRVCGSCRTTIRRYRTKRKAVELLGGRCIRCGYDENIAAMEFHHVKGEKEFTIGMVANKSWSIVVEELKKCELLCSNCHRIEHSNRGSEKFLIEVENYNGTLLES